MIHTPHVAFVGKAGAGKTTAAEMLVKYFAYERLSFAAPLKVMVGDDKDRGKLQDVGVSVRAACPDGWVNLLIEDMYRREDLRARHYMPFAGYTVDDCRFPNEALRLKMEDFIIVRVVANQHLRVARLKANGKWQSEEQLDHVSETALDDYTPDYTIWNEGDAEELLNSVTKILNRERS